MLEAQLLMVEKILGFDAQIPAVRRLAKAAVPCRDAVDARYALDVDWMVGEWLVNGKFDGNLIVIQWV